MKIYIKKDELLRQLPKHLRYLLIASVDELPYEFEFTGRVTEENKLEHVEKRGAFEKKYKKVFKILTPIEWQMFCDLVESSEGIRYVDFLKYMNTSQISGQGMGNLVAVHAKGIRSKFSLYGIPFELETRRQNSFSQGRYILKSV